MALRSEAQGLILLLIEHHIFLQTVSFFKFLVENIIIKIIVLYEKNIFFGPILGVHYI